MKLQLALPIALTTTLIGCTWMPGRFHEGNPYIHPRFGYRITNETADYFDLEVIVMDYSLTVTHGDPEIEEAKRVFIKFLKKYEETNHIQVVEPPLVELTANCVRSTLGTNTVRVGKRVFVKKKRPPTRSRSRSRGRFDLSRGHPSPDL